MKHASGRSHAKVLKLCQDINRRASDHEQLQTLVFRLQEVLSEEHGTVVIEMKTRQVEIEEDPFDKILAA